MADFKEGDRIKVEFEGTVTYKLGRGFEVVTDGGGRFEFYHPENFTFTKVEPPIVLPEVPGTIVQIDPMNKHDQHRIFYFEFDEDDELQWWGGSTYYPTEYVTNMGGKYGYRVIEAVTE